MNRARGVDRAGTLVVWLSALLVTAVLAFMVGDLTTRGIRGLSPAYLFGSPADAGRQGGILPIIVSTAALVAICHAFVLPIGVGTAIFLVEVVPAQNRFGRIVRLGLEVLAGVPSVIFGLFGSALFCNVLGFGFSLLSGGLTLACMVLPFFIRATEEGLRAVSDEVRMTAAGLGLTRTRALFRVIIPAASFSLSSAVLLATGRALAETAALIFTSGYVDRMPRSLLDSGRSISIHIYDLAMNVPGGDQNAARSALVLLFSVCAMNIVFRRIAMKLARA